MGLRRTRVNDPDGTVPGDTTRGGQDSGGYSCCGGRNSHRNNCSNKDVKDPANVNRKDPNRKVCGFTWTTRGAAHTHICGEKPHGNRKSHVCEHPNCTDLPPHRPGLWNPGGSGKTPPPPGGGGSGPGGGACRRCGGKGQVPGPRRTYNQCPVCLGSGHSR